MKIEAVKLGEYYTERKVTWCCERMGTAWFSAVVRFGDGIFCKGTVHPVVRLNANSGKLFGLISRGVGTPIDYRPWCGAKITINVKQEDDQTWSTYNCRCSRMLHFSNPPCLLWYVKAECTRCHGTGWVMIENNEIWKRNGISIA